MFTILLALTCVFSAFCTEDFDIKNCHVQLRRGGCATLTDSGKSLNLKTFLIGDVLFEEGDPVADFEKLAPLLDSGDAMIGLAAVDEKVRKAGRGDFILPVFYPSSECIEEAVKAAVEDGKANAEWLWVTPANMGPLMQAIANRHDVSVNTILVSSVLGKPVSFLNHVQWKSKKVMLLFDVFVEKEVASIYYAIKNFVGINTDISLGFSFGMCSKYGDGSVFRTLAERLVQMEKKHGIVRKEEEWLEHLEKDIVYMRCFSDVGESIKIFSPWRYQSLREKFIFAYNPPDFGAVFLGCVRDGEVFCDQEKVFYRYQLGLHDLVSRDARYGCIYDCDGSLRIFPTLSKWENIILACPLEYDCRARVRFLRGAKILLDRVRNKIPCVKSLTICFLTKSGKFRCEGVWPIGRTMDKCEFAAKRRNLLCEAVL